MPRKTISPGSSSAIAASAIAAPTPDAAIVLWPQPWPRPGQRVVLGEDPDPRAVAGPTAGEWRGPRSRRLPAGCSTANPWRAQGLGDPGRGLALLERRLRVGVDPVRQLDDLVAGGLDGGGDARLGVRERGGRAGGGQRGHAVSWLAWDGPPDDERTIPGGGASALGGEGRLGDDDEGDDEQRDRQLEESLEAQDDEDGDDEADPGRRGGWRAASRPGRRSGDGGRRRSATASGIERQGDGQTR